MNDEDLGVIVDVMRAQLREKDATMHDVVKALATLIAYYAENHRALYIYATETMYMAARFFEAAVASGMKGEAQQRAAIESFAARKAAAAKGKA